MKDPLFNISYGLYVITACENQHDNGCIADAFMQVTSAPEQVALCMNKTGLTCQMIERTGHFTASVINVDAQPAIFKNFGFQSGRDVDKFAEFKDVRRVADGTLAITSGTNAFISVKVDSVLDLGSHKLFIGKVTEKELLNDIPSITYTYYRENMKPEPAQSATGDKNVVEKGVTVWICPICGYEYIGEELPADFVCPLCLEPGSSFEKVVR